MVSIEKGYIGDSNCIYGDKEVTNIYVECDYCGEYMDEDSCLYEYEGKYYCGGCLLEVVPCVTAKTLIKNNLYGE